ncbi:sugar transferase [Francisella sp. LA112445]|uniref:sugar transferase n=1 Tax=Francisella sp. LA112445 TaxID=1395624 RepID=UPI001788C29D|nr:sugar transferase [Francisella sp. LA112445]QIW09645.1 sugar transferase [Francisella sp. LA112445]
MPKKTLYTLFFKRFLDIVLSLMALIILSPVILVLAMLIRFKLGSPVLFKQARPGKDEKIFNLYKFRTMTDARDADGNLLPDSARLTKFGKFIRSTSLDELPSLINILKGDMSIVGPRPLLVEYLELYSYKQRKRHIVRPGLTGWAQINGRNATTWQARFENDIYYVSNVSFALDTKIILKTFVKVFKRSGVSSSDSVTMEKFEGNE